MPRKKAKQQRGLERAGDQAAVEIKRLWGDVPVTDATNDLRVFIQECDVAGAERKNPSCCVFARACKRQFVSTKVLFFRSIAYVELPEENGQVRVERFTMPVTMRALVEAFDRGEGVIPKAGFLLKAPAKARRLDSKQYRSSLERKRTRYKLEGERVTSEGIGRGKGAYRDEPIVIDLAVRSGTGAVHFNPTKNRKSE